MSAVFSPEQEIHSVELAAVCGGWSGHDVLDAAGRVYSKAIHEDFDSAPCMGQSMMVGGTLRNLTMLGVTLGGVGLGAKFGKRVGSAAMGGLAANTVGNWIEDMAKTKGIIRWSASCDKK